MAGLDAPTMLSEHAELMRDIRSSGTEILTIPELRGSAIEAPRSRGTWETWLRATYPKLAAHPKAVTAQTLLGRDPATLYRTWPDGSYRHIVDENGADDIIAVIDAESENRTATSPYRQRSHPAIADQELARLCGA